MQYVIHKDFSKWEAGNKYINREDLESVGIEGLICAIDHYNPNKEAFSTYAYASIYNAIKRFISTSCYNGYCYLSNDSVVGRYNKFCEMPENKELEEKQKLNKFCDINSYSGKKRFEILSILSNKYDVYYDAEFPNSKDDSNSYKLSDYIKDDSQSDFVNDIILMYDREFVMNVIDWGMKGNKPMYTKPRSKNIYKKWVDNIMTDGNPKITEISKEFGVSKQYVHQIIKYTNNRIKNRFKLYGMNSSYDLCD